MGRLEDLRPELFTTDLKVLDDPLHREFVLTLDERGVPREVGRIPYAEVFQSLARGERVAGLLLARVPEHERNRAHAAL